MAKIHWNQKKSAEAPAPTLVPDTLHDIDFMVRDWKRFADGGNWGYAQFNYDAASDTFTPLGTGAKCGHRVPYDRGGKRLRLHGLPEEVRAGPSRSQIERRGVRQEVVKGVHVEHELQRA